jgi:hypothetical protein
LEVKEAAKSIRGIVGDPISKISYLPEIAPAGQPTMDLMMASN